MGISLIGTRLQALLPQFFLKSFYYLKGKEIRRFVEEDNQVLSLDYNYDGSYFATGGKDLKVAK